MGSFFVTPHHSQRAIMRTLLLHLLLSNGSHFQVSRAFAGLLAICLLWCLCSKKTLLSLQCWRCRRKAVPTITWADGFSVAFWVGTRSSSLSHLSCCWEGPCTSPARSLRLFGELWCG